MESILWPEANYQQKCMGAGRIGFLNAITQSEPRVQCYKYDAVCSLFYSNFARSSHIWRTPIRHTVSQRHFWIETLLAWLFICLVRRRGPQIFSVNVQITLTLWTWKDSLKVLQPYSLSLKRKGVKLSWNLILITCKNCPTESFFIYVINLRKLEQGSTLHLSKFYPIRLKLCIP